MNRNNYNPNIWGKHGWIFIDTSILSYPINNPSNDIKKQYYNFLESLKTILPCNECRDHYNDYFNNNVLNDEILSSRDNLLQWILNCRNNINHINNKKILLKEEFMNYYNDIYNKKCLKCINKIKKPINYTKIMNYFILFIIICIIIYYKFN